MASGSWAPTSGCGIQEEKERGEEKRKQSNREYSSKVLISKELHYICMHWYQMEKGYRIWTELQNARIRGGSLVVSKTMVLVTSILQ